MSAIALIESATRSALPDPVILAVSGGVDSMVLLDAAARVAPRSIAAIVTIDHGTGSAATRAAACVVDRSQELGIEVVRRRVHPSSATEAAWRVARWAALREEAASRGARIATAHTRDDQIETVLMRVMRGAGARGLAGLHASSGRIIRPLIDIDRQSIMDYAALRSVPFVEDPSNQSLAFLRNRIRLELLPALARARPELPHELLAIGERAAEWRRDVDRAIDAFVPHRLQDGAVAVSLDALAHFPADALRILWPALAARAGVVLDRRGTERLTSFSIQSRRGGRIQLSGGVEAARHGDELRIRQTVEAPADTTVRLNATAQLGGWRFVRTSEAKARNGEWEAALPTDRPLSVRTWRAGDRIVPTGERSGMARRVKRLLREAGIEAGIRAGWPVVLSGDEIVWIPGVRRGIAATVRSGRPVAIYRCERIHR